LQPIDVWYEDDLETGYVETTRRLIASIGINAPTTLAVSTNYEKQADGQSEMLVQRFRDAAGSSLTVRSAIQWAYRIFGRHKQ
jgi:LPS sulfotransferase NodH